MTRVNNIINSKVKNKVKVCLFKKKKKPFYSYICFHQILKIHEFINQQPTDHPSSEGHWVLKNVSTLRNITV